MKRFLVLLLGVLIVFSTIGFARGLEGKAAEKIDRDADRVWVANESDVPRRIIYKAQSAVQFQNYFDRYAGISSADLRQVRQFEDELGMRHTRYRQYYQNLEIIGSDYILHERDGRVVSANGFLFSDFNMAVTPSISEAEALKIALQQANAQLYKWQSEPENFDQPRGELVITSEDYLMTRASFALVYRFDVYAERPTARYVVDVDARNGDIINFYNRIHTADVAASGNSLYNGTVSFTADFTGSIYRLRQTASGNGIQTYDMNNGTSYGAASDITSGSSTFNNDGAAVNAHWGAEQTYDYFFNEHNRNSYNGNGAVIRSYVHYSNNYVNAFWDGSRMTYGDGDGVNYGPLTSIDIVSHEITHGVTDFSSDLVYSYESGALNESFSDIFGEAVENYATGSNDWLMGDDIGIGGSGAFRNMSNPNQFNDPDTYKGDFWHTSASDNGGVHVNSGVQNFWFYLLVNGGSGTNDNSDSYSVNAIGIDAAGAIAYRNNNVYLTTTSNYSDAYLGSLDAAADLYGSGSAQYNAVQDAWDAVGVDDSNAGGGSNPGGGGGGCIAALTSFVPRQFDALTIAPTDQTIEFANKIHTSYEDEMNEIFAVLASQPEIQRDLYLLVREAQAFINGQNSVAITREFYQQFSDVLNRTRAETQDIATRRFLDVVAKTVQATPEKAVYSRMLENVFNNLTIENEAPLSKQGAVVNSFDLLRSFPNPFNPETTVKFYLNEKATVSLIIYNAAGQQVAELVNGQLPEGEKSFTWDARNFGSGIYFAKLQAGNSVKTIKMILMK